MRSRAGLLAALGVLAMVFITPGFAWADVFLYSESPPVGETSWATLIKVGEGPLIPQPNEPAVDLRATPAQVEEILQTCLDKGIDLELIFKQWQVSRLEDLEENQVQQVQEWLEKQ